MLLLGATVLIGRAVPRLQEDGQRLGYGERGRPASNEGEQFSCRPVEQRSTLPPSKDPTSSSKLAPSRFGARALTSLHIDPTAVDQSFGTRRAGSSRRSSPCAASCG